MKKFLNKKFFSNFFIFSLFYNNIYIYVYCIVYIYIYIEMEVENISYIRNYSLFFFLMLVIRQRNKCKFIFYVLYNLKRHCDFESIVLVLIIILYFTFIYNKIFISFLKQISDWSCLIDVVISKIKPCMSKYICI